MADIATISKEEAKLIIAVEEGHYADAKAIEIKPAKLSKTVSAFANAAGGEIFLGIAETKVGANKKRSWAGFRDIEAANDHIAILDSLGNFGNHYQSHFLRCLDMPGYVLHITVLKTTDILKATDDMPYVRKN